MFGFKFGSRSSITINGVTIEGKDIRMSNGRLIVDGVEHPNSNAFMKEPEITIHVNGNVDEVSTVSGDVNITGNVDSAKSTSGDISIKGDVETVTTVSGDVEARKINSAKTVSGDIST